MFPKKRMEYLSSNHALSRLFISNNSCLLTYGESELASFLFISLALSYIRLHNRAGLLMT
jgi:hypothetical protein